MHSIQYENYRNNNLEWLDKVPENWEERRVKDDAVSNRKSLSEKTDDNFELLYIDISSVEIGGIINNPEPMLFRDSPSRARRIVRKNDVIISTVRTYLKAVAYFETAADNLICSTGFSVLSPRKTVYPTFLKYVILSENFIDKVICNSKGVSYPAINNSELIALSFLAPPLKQQTEIAQYLDEKTAQIDKRVELLQAKKEKYRELRKTIINEAVIKGIDKNIELKDSGVNWIGKIPTHWNFERFGDKFKQNKRKNINLENNNLLSLSYGKIKRKDINSGFGLLPESFEGYQIVEDGDIILRLTDLQNDWNSLRVGLVRETGIITSAYVGLKLSKTLYPTFIYYLLHNYDIKKVFYSQGGSIRQSMKFADIKSLPLLYPDFETQVEIANYLDEKTNKIDEIVKTIDKNIQVLKEFRKTLINDVVTGKVKITQIENTPYERTAITR